MGWLLRFWLLTPWVFANANGGMKRPDALDPLLEEIEAFLVATGMSASAFGRGALNDSALVFDLRQGRECKRAARARIAAFIAAHLEEAV